MTWLRIETWNSLHRSVFGQDVECAKLCFIFPNYDLNMLYPPSELKFKINALPVVEHNGITAENLMPDSKRPINWSILSPTKMLCFDRLRVVICKHHIFHHELVKSKHIYGAEFAFSKHWGIVHFEKGARWDLIVSVSVVYTIRARVNTRYLSCHLIPYPTRIPSDWYIPYSVHYWHCKDQFSKHQQVYYKYAMFN